MFRFKRRPHITNSMRTTDQKYACTLSSRVPNIATINRRETRPVKVEISLIFNKPNVCSRSSLTPGTSSFVEYPSVSPSRYISFFKATNLTTSANDSSPFTTIGWTIFVSCRCPCDPASGDVRDRLLCLSLRVRLGVDV